MSEDRIPMFATRNDTDQFAVCVDGRFGLFPSREDAERVYALIGGRNEEGELEETPFGSAVLLPPGGGGNRTRANLSEFAPVDIEAYIRSSWDDYHNPAESALPVPATAPADPCGDVLANIFMGLDAPKVFAPWIAEQVAALELRQDDPSRHPYTCGRCPAPLVPKREGWYCPSCGRLVQAWAHRQDLDDFLPRVALSHRDEKLVLRLAGAADRRTGWRFDFDTLEAIRRAARTLFIELPGGREVAMRVDPIEWVWSPGCGPPGS